VKKDFYEQYIDPAEFSKLYEEWAKQGKPTGNDPLYLKIWCSITNAVKACIGALQTKYHCKYKDYEDKVMDASIVIIKRLLTMEDTPKNIVNMCYLPVLGICCGPKARNKELEDNSLSIDCLTDGGDSFSDIMYLDEYGNIQYGY
jgi:hypothetical protein